MLNRIIQIIVFYTTILFTSNLYSKEKDMITQHFYIEIALSQLQADIYINDILLFPKNDENGLSTTHPITQWLTSGKNTVNVTLFALKDSELSSGSLDMKIYLHDNEHDFPTPKKILSELNIPKGSDNNGLSKTTKSISFDFDYKTPTNLWNKAEKIDKITTSDKNQIITIIENLKSSFLDSTKVDLAIELQQFKIEEDAMACGHKFERLKEVAKESIQWVNKMPNLKGENLNLKNAKFTISGHNKVVHVTKLNGNNAIHIESEDNVIEVPIYISKIDGSWIIVR